MDTAVLFPGIGYTCDKPLMYYAGKSAARMGYGVIRLTFTGISKNVKGDPAGMRAAVDAALIQAEEQLRDVDWAARGRIVFISKSIGTAVSRRFERDHGLSVRSVLFTPVEETFACAGGEALAFHGTLDPWAATPAVTALCAEQGIRLITFANANHSLETGDPDTDIGILREAIRETEKFLAGGGHVI